MGVGPLTNGTSDISAARVLHDHLIEFDRHPPDGRVIVGDVIVEADDVLSPCAYCATLAASILLTAGHELAESKIRSLT